MPFLARSVVSSTGKEKGRVVFGTWVDAFFAASFCCRSLHRHNSVPVFNTATPRTYDTRCRTKKFKVSCEARGFAKPLSLHRGTWYGIPGTWYVYLVQYENSKQESVRKSRDCGVLQNLMRCFLSFVRRITGNTSPQNRKQGVGR